MMHFVGDLSLVDVDVLAKYVRTAHEILEFGTGGSTMVIAQNKLKDADYIAIETENVWIKKTTRNLTAMSLNDQVVIMNYRDVFTERKLTNASIQNRKFDLIFVDGHPKFRECFFNETFDLLRIGGVILVHDTKRQGDLRWLFRSCIDRWTEISRIDLNLDHSNISVVHKKMHDPYINWNHSEGRQPWQSGYEPPPQGWMQELGKKFKQQISEQDF